MAMMAITTSNSMSVKPRGGRDAVTGLSVSITVNRDCVSVLFPRESVAKQFAHFLNQLTARLLVEILPKCHRRILRTKINALMPSSARTPGSGTAVTVLESAFAPVSKALLFQLLEVLSESASSTVSEPVSDDQT